MRSIDVRQRLLKGGGPVLVLGAVAAIGCSGGERGVSGPGPSGGPTTATLDVTTRVDEQDAELAQSFGWTSGVPGA